MSRNEPRAGRTSTVEHVVSDDGTRIAYMRRGTGPGLVLVQGAMATARSYDDLARALSTRFTVYSAERRGRGLSPREYEETHSITRDVEDIQAIITTTGATRIFGLSSGAVIALEAARTLPQLTQVAVYEPPFYRNGIAREGVDRLNAAVEARDWPRALILALRTAETAPAVVDALPMPLATLLARAVLAVDDRIHRPGLRLRDLLPGVRFDFEVVSEMDGKMNTLTSLDTPVLLLSGSRSPSFLRQAVRDLARVLPHASHTELAGLDHSSPWNSRNGQPEMVAKTLGHFFSPR